jgi:hypothetical protein
MVAQANDRSNLLYIDDETNNDSPDVTKKQHTGQKDKEPPTDTSAPPENSKMNLIWLKKEVDLE